MMISIHVIWGMRLFFFLSFRGVFLGFRFLGKEALVITK